VAIVEVVMAVDKLWAEAEEVAVVEVAKVAHIELHLANRHNLLMTLRIHLTTNMLLSRMMLALLMWITRRSNRITQMEQTLTLISLRPINLILNPSLPTTLTLPKPVKPKLTMSQRYYPLLPPPLFPSIKTQFPSLFPTHNNVALTLAPQTICSPTTMPSPLTNVPPTASFNWEMVLDYNNMA
jgi:hypothetical protein